MSAVTLRAVGAPGFLLVRYRWSEVVCGQGRGRTADLPLFRRMSGSTRVHAVRLIRPDNLLGHLGVQDRPHVSTTVVSAALATGLSIRRSDLPLLGAGSQVARSLPWRLPCSIRLRWPLCPEAKSPGRYCGARLQSAGCPAQMSLPAAVCTVREIAVKVSRCTVDCPTHRHAAGGLHPRRKGQRGDR